MPMQDITVLEKLGLTKNERTIYLTLLELGSATVSGITKKTALHRSYVYDILDKLIDLGLVASIIKNKKKYFQTGHPDNLLEIIHAQEEEIKDDRETIKKIIPELIKRQNLSSEKQKAEIFVGKNGIKEILEDILKTKRDFVAFGAEGKFKNIFKWYFENWQRRRVELKIKYKIIYNRKLKGKRPTITQKLMKLKFLPEKYTFPATTLIYGNKTAVIIWEIDPIVFLLDSSQATISFLNYFELLWKIAKP